MPYMEIGAIELCIFFPRHSQWFPFLMRLKRHGWPTETIARAQLHGRGTLNKTNVEKLGAALRHQISTGGKEYYSDPSWTNKRWEQAGHPDSKAFNKTFPSTGNNVSLYNVSSWAPNDPSRLAQVPPTLYQIVRGVANWPTGQDAGLLTQALQWARTRGDVYLATHTINDIPAIIAAHPTWSWPSDATTRSWDARALVRFSLAVPRPAA